MTGSAMEQGLMVEVLMRHSFFLLERGVAPPIPCMNLKTKGLQNGMHVSA